MFYLLSALIYRTAIITLFIPYSLKVTQKRHITLRDTCISSSFSFALRHLYSRKCCWHVFIYSPWWPKCNKSKSNYYQSTTKLICYVLCLLDPLLSNVESISQTLEKHTTADWGSKGNFDGWAKREKWKSLYLIDVVEVHVYAEESVYHMSLFGWRSSLC